MRQEAAEMLRADVARIQRIVDGEDPDVGVKAMGRELVRHLTWAAEALESDPPSK